MPQQTSALPTLQDPSLIHHQSLINGVWVDADNGSQFEVRDPATGKLLISVANLGGAQTERAIAAASAALPAWRARTGKERAGILRKWFDLMNQHQDDLARLMTAEQGKPVAEARGEVAYAASFIEWFAEEAKRVTGDTLASPFADKRMLVIKQPIGVCAAITPWNFPLAMITRKAAPALAAGCTMIIKPAHQTPLSALALADLALRAGVPAGVISVVTGDGENASAIGKALCASPVVRKLSFTGSTPVGRLLMEQCAPTVKKVALELGGLAPFIVFDDADIPAAVEGALISKYRNAGQTCVCTNRFYVHDKIHDEFVARLAEGSRRLKLGNGFDDGVQQGPLIDDRAMDKVERHVADALAGGARLITGGKRSSLGDRFYEPTVLTDMRADMLIAREETFGPVAAVFRFHDDADVIFQANNTEFGLAAYFYSRDINRVWRVAEALEYGMVGINTGLISNEVAPFGGVKQSGLGREGSHYGMDDYLELKYLCMGGI